jgi:hypothetical protein
MSRRLDAASVELDRPPLGARATMQTEESMALTKTVRDSSKNTLLALVSLKHDR